MSFSTTVSMLPRTTSDMQTIAVNLKRRSQYEHAFLTANIRPECVRQVGKYLSQHGDLFKKEKISFSTSALEALQTNENFIIATDGDTDPSVCSDVNFEICYTDPSTSLLLNSSEVTNNDSWNEVDDVHTERAGVYDTFFTSPDYVEPTERQGVYGHTNDGHCDKVYSFAPAEHNKPVSIFLDLHSEELAFPNIFWGFARSEIHPVQIHYSDIVKSELRRRDRRVAMCVENIFYKFKRCQMHSILSKVNVAVRKHKTGHTTFKAGQFRHADAVDKLIKFDDGYRILKEIRGSPPYWEKAQKDVYAMIRQLGPGHLFLTLSAAETRWIHLLKILSVLVDNVTLSDDDISSLSWSTKCRLISADPVTCARHFDYSIHQFFNSFLKSFLSPFGMLADFWYRIEFQQRGSPHMHCLLWLKDVPVYGVDTDEKVISYVDSIVTCQRTWDNSELSDLVNLQVHMHTRSCKKQFRKRTVCRFDFPKVPMSETRILQPLPEDEVDKKLHSENFLRIKSLLSQFKPDSESLSMEEFLNLVGLDLDGYLLAIRSSLRSPTVYVKRAVNEVRVNNYNVHCLHAWRANMDIQFILDVYACASYITSYVAKSERGMSELLRSACQEARQGNVNLKQQVRIISNKFVNNVEVSAQEAVYQLLQMPLKRSSRQVIFLNTSPPEERVYLLKSNLDLLPDDADIAASNVITRYVSRAAELQNVCFADCYNTASGVI